MALADKLDWDAALVAPTPEEDAEIIAAALDDPDAQPLTDAQLAAMVPMRAIRGRPKKGETTTISVISDKAEIS